MLIYFSNAPLGPAFNPRWREYVNDPNKKEWLIRYANAWKELYIEKNCHDTLLTKLWGGDPDVSEKMYWNMMGAAEHFKSWAEQMHIVTDEVTEQVV